MDRTLFYAVNHGMSNSLFDWLMPVITRYESWIPVGILLGAYLLRKKPAKGLAVIVTLVIAVVVSDFVNHSILKEFFARIRPCAALPDARLLTGCGGSFSFPSSHAVNSFTIASILGFYDRKLWRIAVPSAALVAFSRVYVGVHYPFDVLAGAVLGIGFGYAAARIAGFSR